MGNDNRMKSSMGEKTSDPDLKPDTTPNPVEDLAPANEQRSLDVGESGQFAPGGRYNELGATAPRRIDLDEQLDSALKNEEK
jgi:hypothetical protein